MAFRRASAIVGALALVAAFAVPSFAQEKRKLTKDEQTQYEAIHAVVDDVAAGKRPAPADLKVTFYNHFIKSPTDVYVPYTLVVEPGKLAELPAVLYVRAIAKSGAAAAMAKQAGKNAKPFAFEDVAFVTPGADNTVQRALQLVPGDYDVVIALSEKMPKDKKAPAPKMLVYTQPLTVPDLSTGLTTSSVILAKSIDPADAQPNAQQQLEQPYTISGYKIVPTRATSFPKTSELLWVFYIYNEGAAATGKPDVNVEYTFAKAGEDKPFVNIPASAFNATTLPPEFNLAAGHILFVAQGVPLATIAPGDYKLQIKVTDKTNNQSVTRDVPFSVTQ